ncbi:MAG: O-antigen ligase family protein [Pseudomonadales bacterium]
MLFTLWLGFGLVQMIPLPASIVAVLSPNTAVLYQQAHLGPLLANQDIAANPVRALPVFTRDRGAKQLGSEPDRNDLTAEAASDAATEDRLVFKLPATASTASARLTLDLPASLASWMKSLAYVLVFGLTLLLIDSTRRLKTLAYIIVLSGLAQAVYGSLSLAIDGGGVANGSFVNRNHFAAYLVLGLSIGIGLLVASMGGTRVITWRQRLRHLGVLLLSSKAPLRIFLAIMVIALVLTHSRGGNASFFASMLIAGSLALALIRNMPRPVIVLIASLIVIDIFIIGSWVGLEKVTERLMETSMETEARDEFDRYSLRMWQDYPLFGVGAGSYYSALPRYREGDTNTNWAVDHAHNDYLEFLTEYGIVGILLPTGVVILALGNAVLAMRRRRSQFAKGIGFAVLMAITAMLIHATVEFNLQIPAYAVTFIVVLAMAWLARYLESGKGP